MGNLLDKKEQQLSESLQGEYQIQSHPNLLHRATNQLCTLHKLTSNSAPNSSRIAQIIEEYQRTKCESISRLQAHYHRENTAYCSDEETFYVIFVGQNSYSVKEELVKRRFYQRPFQEEEIRQIVETYLCGLREYSQRFQREYEKLGLDCIILDQFTRRIYLRDPWLCGQAQAQKSETVNRLMQSYPSPEKLNALLSPRMENFNQFLSNLFSVGVISLELKRLDFADTVYSKRKEIQRDEIERRLSEFKDPKLRRGIELLLNPDPIARKQIYSIWGIENREQHFITPIKEDKQMEQAYVAATQRPMDLADTRKKSNPKISMNAQKPSEVITQGQSGQVPPQHLEHLQGNQKRNGSIQSSRVNTARNTSDTNRNVNFQLGAPITHPNFPQNLPPNRSMQQQNQLNQSGHLRQSSLMSHSIHLSQMGQLKQSFHTGPPIVGQPTVHFKQPEYNNLSHSGHINQPGRINIPNPAPAQPSRPNQFSQPNQYGQPNQPQPNLGNRSRPYQNSHLESDKNNGYFSFKDYMHNLEVHPGSRNNREPSPIRPNNQPVVKVNPPPPKTIPNAIIPNNVQPTQSPNLNLGTYKQSYTYYEQPPLKISQDNLRRESEQTHIQSRVDRDSKLSPVFQVQNFSKVEDKEIKPAAKRDYSQNVQSKQLSPDKNRNYSLEIKKQTSPPQTNQNPNISEAESFLIKNELPKQNGDTPQRPTTKNKYNSTIVEVKDQDTPEHSVKSDDPVQEEYVQEQYETGSRYQGFKSRGMRNGRGRFFYQDGGYYEGQWKNNKMDGFGKLFYEGGKLAYEGQWSQDEFNGLGKVYNDNPVSYKGSFDYANFDYLQDYWEYYEGMLVKDTKEGRGRIKLSNGQIFQGDFHEDKIQGFGKFHTLDGKSVEGIWRQSKLIKVIKIS